MALTAGTRLGHYEITGALGAGGMGEVYRARDTQLGRDVAIKVLPPALANDPGRMARFEREAQLLAALNHPNIAAIYGVEQGALVMELVEGPTLEERIAKAALPLDEALAIARQIAEGLEAAHERTIVHRDLKPANIKVTAAGVVKLLDFGLAKAASEPSDASVSPTMSPTLSIAMTQAGMILGTAAYMSPEQARGKPADRRADIWAFGVVLYEMLTGRHLFGGGDTVADSLAAVIAREPDWSALPKGAPPHIRRLLERCLRKDVKTRLQAIGEARVLIDEPMEAAPVVAAPAPARQRSRLPWAVAGVLAIGLAAAGLIAWQATRPINRPMMRLSLDVAPNTVLARANGGAMLALSPDGTRVAVTLKGADGQIRLYTRLLHQSQLTPLAGTEGAYSPFFSPDGQWIGFFTDTKLKKVSVEGGAAMTLGDVSPVGRGASWGDDGNIVLSPGLSNPLVRIPSAGGTPMPLVKLKEGERTHRFPQVLPGSLAVLFTASSATGVYDDADIEALSLKTGARKTVHRGGHSPRYLPSGYLVYLHETTLFAAPFDAGRLAMTGEPVPVLEDVSSASGAGGDFAFSQTGAFVYLTGIASQGWSIFWLDKAGKREVLHAPPGVYFSPRFSPDGKRLAYSLGGQQAADIWVKDLDRNTPTRLTSLQGENNYLVWTPGGRNLIFRNVGSKSPGMYMVRSDGSGEPQRLTEGTADLPYSVSPDGKRLAFSRGDIVTRDIFTASIEGGRLGKPELFLGTKFPEGAPAFSPDGRWMAYSSNSTGIDEVYVRPFPGPGGVVQISTGGGLFPVWSRDGRELLFQTPGERRILTAGYKAKGDSFVAEKPRPWADTSLASTPGGNAVFDLAPDGKRLAVFEWAGDAPGQKPLTQLTVLINFFDELRRRAPGR